MKKAKSANATLRRPKILGLRKARFAERMSPEELFGEDQGWLTERIRSVLETGEAETLIDAAVNVRGQELSLNLGVLPLLTAQQEQLGVIVMLEDISSEKRMKSTMSRYMDANLAEKILSESEDVLGGRSVQTHSPILRHSKFYHHH